ncbi:MAG: hypothetical protein SH817_03430 [Leptospira sp.]|nr:hypothetical protein [Leptospira sp.]
MNLIFNLLSIFFISICFSSSIMSQTNSNFAHPLQIEPVAVYKKIRGDFSYWDKRYLGVYEQNRNFQVEGEYIFWNNFSATSSIGRNNYSISDAMPETTWDRWNFGLKYGKVFDFGSSQLLVGGGIRLYDKRRNSEIRERENPDYYLVRPNFGIGYKNGRFEVMTEFRFQTETNRSFREGNLEEFRRYYQFGIAPSVELSPSFRAFTEFEYREPFDKLIDSRTRFLNFYPGISYKSDSSGTMSVSLLFSLLAKNDNAMDRGIRISYFYFFETGSTESSTKKDPTTTIDQEKKITE